MQTEDVVVDAGGMAADVRMVEHLGGAQLIHLDIAGHTLLMQADAECPVRRGERLHVAVMAERTYLFDPETGTTIHAPGRGARVRGDRGSNDIPQSFERTG